MLPAPPSHFFENFWLGQIVTYFSSAVYLRPARVDCYLYLSREDCLAPPAPKTYLVFVTIRVVFPSELPGSESDNARGLWVRAAPANAKCLALQWFSPLRVFYFALEKSQIMVQDRTVGLSEPNKSFSIAWEWERKDRRNFGSLQRPTNRILLLRQQNPARQQQTLGCRVGAHSA
eukprot:TRINITY_DN1973_c0_g1_i3.p1 TRINITY_DN1973_c0_g1~~TRINITY_DN1973_c0_g1_i3.p1  ORF type:complete len:175 (-),score=25.92 TRINITY_DN1973_c0_g1_i3:217-741(-)